MYRRIMFHYLLTYYLVRNFISEFHLVMQNKYIISQLYPMAYACTELLMVTSHNALVLVKLHAITVSAPAPCTSCVYRDCHLPLLFRILRLWYEIANTYHAALCCREEKTCHLVLYLDSYFVNYYFVCRLLLPFTCLKFTRVHFCPSPCL